MSRISITSTPLVQQSWLECAKWLDECNVLPDNFKERIKQNQLTISELVYTLQDGIVLCNLINAIAPGAIETNSIQRHTQDRPACLKNIRLFLKACKNKLELTDQDLFQPQMLYDLDIECVIVALSKISKIKKVEQTIGSKGFDINVSQAEQHIYYNIQPIEKPDSMYTPDVVSLHTDENDLIYELFLHGAVDDHGSISGKKTSINFSKQDYVIREIYDTENRYVKLLNAVINDFMNQLNVLNDEDKKLIFKNFEALFELHTKLSHELQAAIKGGRTSRICKVFESYKIKMMKEYFDYIAGMKNAVSKVDYFITENAEFRLKLEECRKKSEFGCFKLKDLIKIPYQRVLKYHLFFNELNKQTDEQHYAKRDIAQTLACMIDLANYLNEAHRG